MIDPHQLGRVSHQARRQGDPRETRPGQGESARATPSTRLEKSIRRQVEHWHLEASEDLATGPGLSGLDGYEAAGRLRLERDPRQEGLGRVLSPATSKTGGTRRESRSRSSA
jgi:hypothetical protein